MFFKRTKNRVFDHVPRFYNPAEDEQEKRKKKLKFRIDPKIKKRTKIPVTLLILLGVIIYFVVKLSSM